jgi:steroid delta-isomerase-like uncharacterized protein
MSTEELKKLVSRYVEEVWNRADFAVFESLTTDTFTYRLGGQPARDKSAMRELLETVHRAFPDWRARIRELVAEGNVAAVRWTGEVTHQGTFHGIPATGRRVTVSGINVYEIEEGRIAREWEQMDSLSLLQQLGALPAPEEVRPTGRSEPGPEDGS